MVTQAEKDEADILSVMRTEAGRRLLAKILDECGMSRSGCSENSLKMAQLTGKREVGVWLDRQLMTHAPDYYIGLIKEKINNAN